MTNNSIKTNEELRNRIIQKINEKYNKVNNTTTNCPYCNEPTDSKTIIHRTCMELYKEEINKYNIVSKKVCPKCSTINLGTIECVKCGYSFIPRSNYISFGNNRNDLYIYDNSVNLFYDFDYTDFVKECASDVNGQNMNSESAVDYIRMSNDKYDTYETMKEKLEETTKEIDEVYKEGTESTIILNEKKPEYKKYSKKVKYTIFIYVLITLFAITLPFITAAAITIILPFVAGVIGVIHVNIIKTINSKETKTYEQLDTKCKNLTKYYKQLLKTQEELNNEIVPYENIKFIKKTTEDTIINHRIHETQTNLINILNNLKNSYNTEYDNIYTAVKDKISNKITITEFRDIVSTVLNFLPKVEFNRFIRKVEKADDFSKIVGAINFYINYKPFITKEIQITNYYATEEVMYKTLADIIDVKKAFINTPNIDINNYEIKMALSKVKSIFYKMFEDTTTISELSGNDYIADFSSKYVTTINSENLVEVIINNNYSKNDVAEFFEYGYIIGYLLLTKANEIVAQQERRAIEEAERKAYYEQLEQERLIREQTRALQAQADATKYAADKAAEAERLNNKALEAHISEQNKQIGKLVAIVEKERNSTTLTANERAKLRELKNQWNRY